MLFVPVHAAFLSPPRDEREGQKVPESSLCPLYLSTTPLTVRASLFYKSMIITKKQFWIRLSPSNTHI